jgi:hypothetical protein
MLPQRSARRSRATKLRVVKITMRCYQLPHICPAAHGLFGRPAGTFLIHPGLLGKSSIARGSGPRFKGRPTRARALRTG